MVPVALLYALNALRAYNVREVKPLRVFCQCFCERGYHKLTKTCFHRVPNMLSFHIRAQLVQ